MPPLRERRAEISELLRQCLAQLEREHGIRKRFSLAAENRLMSYEWPGNVQELQHIVERLFLSTEATVIDDVSMAFAHLPRHKNHTGRQKNTAHYHGLKAAVTAFERDLVMQAYSECQTIYEMARYLGISQTSVVRRLRKFGLASAKEENES